MQEIRRELERELESEVARRKAAEAASNSGQMEMENALAKQRHEFDDVKRRLETRIEQMQRKHESSLRDQHLEAIASRTSAQDELRDSMKRDMREQLREERQKLCELHEAETSRMSQQYEANVKKLESANHELNTRVERLKAENAAKKKGGWPFG